MKPASTPAPSRARSLAERALARPGSPFRVLPARVLVVDVARQRLVLLEEGEEVAAYPVSTAAAGLGSAAGSRQTPLGWHGVHDRIGEGVPAGAVFESRVPTGAVWDGEQREDDLILTRVLTLEGLEPGVNRGAGCDSLERYIYIHGTNHERALGQPASHGCVRMANADVLDLFARVAAGDAVVLCGDPDDDRGRDLA